MANSLSHNAYESLELEFYIQAAVWTHPATEHFLSDIYAMFEGATLLGGAKGVWKGQVETTNIVKVIVRKSKIQVGDALSLVQKAIDQLLREWGESSRDRQEAFIFTMRELILHEARETRDGGR